MCQSVWYKAAQAKTTPLKKDKKTKKYSVEFRIHHLRAPRSLFGHHLSRLRPQLRSRERALITTLSSLGLLTVDAALVLEMPLVNELLVTDRLVRMARLAGHTDSLVAGSLLLPAVRAVMALLAAGLADERLAHAPVDVARRGARERVLRLGVLALLAVAAQDVVVVRLRRDLVDRVGLVCAASGRGACREDLRVEFRDAVVARLFAAELVLRLQEQSRSASMSWDRKSNPRGRGGKLASHLPPGPSLAR